MREFVVLVSLAFAAAAASPAVGAEIYKCIDEGGNIEYQQLPCPEPKPAVENDAEEGSTDQEPVPGDAETLEPAAMLPESSRQPGEAVDDCKKRYRDQIDEIDAEILVSFSPELADDYKSRLRDLTQQLRACE